MLTELLVNVATKLRPLRYAVEQVTYRSFYQPPDPALDFAAWQNRFKGRPMLVVGNGRVSTKRL